MRNTSITKRTEKKTDIETIIAPHLPNQLFPDPLPNLRPPLPIQPPHPLHLPHDPLPPTLFRQHIAKARIVRRAPEREVREEEDFAECPGCGAEEDELEGEEEEVEDVEVRLWVGGM